MPFMPEGVIHPESPCAECGRVMVYNEKSRDVSGNRWQGTVIFHSNGTCDSCRVRLARRPEVDKRRDMSIAKLYRGPAMPFEQTEAGYSAWVERRRQRLAQECAR